MSTNKAIHPKSNSLLWQVDLKGHRGYIAGTMHTSFAGYEKILQRFFDVFELADIQSYFGETDMSEMAARQSMPEMAIPPLKDQMTPIRFAKFRKKLKQYTNIDLLHCDRIPPMITSTLIASQLLNSRGVSIDQALWNKAQNLDIEVKGLESFDEQMQIFYAIPYAYQIIQLKKILSNLSKSRASLNKMVELYRSEAIHTLYRLGKKTLGPTRQLMLNDRNDRMVSRMVGHLEQATHPIFFTFGAAHLAGEYGILHGLKRKGCSLKPLRG